jgi:hypothetical protein
MFEIRPKHGKEDNKPHVGGNTWAGGTGRFKIQVLKI